MRKILVTGGMGFIGSHMVRLLLRMHADVDVINFDKLTYAGNPANLLDIAADPRLAARYRFVRGDVCDPVAVSAAMAGCWAVVHLAAESHVDRSISAWGQFLQAEVVGTTTLLEAALAAGVQRFLQVSTDEVYGDIPTGHYSVESDALHPRSPYAAAKAAAEQFCFAFHATHGVPVVISRASNNMGPNQHPEKMIPLFTTNALLGRPLPVYGDGRQVRDWLYVEDHCRALDVLLHEGEAGEVYNIGAGNEERNLVMAERIIELTGASRSLIRHIGDRKGHDRRYALASSKLRALGWRPIETVESMLAKTVSWYCERDNWWRAVRDAEFDAYYERLYAARLAEAAP